MEITAQFQRFVDFARAAHETGNAKSIARVGEGTALEGHTITAATTDKVAAFRRSRTDMDANNVVRDIFRQSVIDMFGGESNVPENVRTAMSLEDYGAGKPLTARRILAVQAEVAKASTQFDQAFAAGPFFFSTLLTVLAQTPFVTITHPLGASVRLNPKT